MKTLKLLQRNLLYILLTCVGCADSPSLVEQIGKDVRDIQSEFEKGYKQPNTSWISVDTVIIDTTVLRAIEQGQYRYYRVKFVGTSDPR